MANTTHSPGSVSPTNTAAAGSNNHSGRPAPTADQWPQTKLGRLYQTNGTVCGKVALFFKQRGDWLCTLIYSSAYLREEDLVKARRLSQPREQVCELVKAVLHHVPQWMDSVRTVLLSSFSNMPSLVHHFCESCYKSLLLQRKHLLWLPALRLANAIVIIIPGRVRFTVIMSATLIQLGGQHHIISVKWTSSGVGWLLRNS